MRKFKTKLFTLISALILSCSCFLFAPQEGVEVKAEHIEGTNSAYVISNYFGGNNNITMEIAGDTESEILSHYYTYNSAANRPTNKIYSKVYENNRIYHYSSLNTEAKFQTQVMVGENNAPLRMAINNGVIQIALSATTGDNVSSTQYMKLGDSTTNMTSDKSTFSTEPQVMTSYTYNIEFYAKSKTGDVPAFTYLDIQNPTIILTTTDVVAPTAELTADMNNLEWSGEESRTITFEVTDNGVGVQKALVYDQSGNEITPTLVSMSADTKTAIYSFTASCGNSYYVKTWDNVNNVQETTLITASQLHFDNSGSNLSISMDKTIHSSKFSVNFNYTHDGLSEEETLYYKVVSGQKDSVPENLTDTKAIFTNNLSETQTIDITDFFSSGAKDGVTYTLMARTIDKVGNETDATFSFTYDTRQYVSDISVVGGKIIEGKNGAESLGTFTEQAFSVWHNDYVEFSFESNSGYELYKVWRYGLKNNENGSYEKDDSTKEDITELVEQNGSAYSYGYNCTENYAFVIKFRYRVKMTSCSTDFIYTADENGDGVTQYIAYTLNDDDIDTGLVNIEYYYQGKKVSGLKDAGSYTIEWAIDTDDYIGGGEFDLSVKPKDIGLSYSGIDGLIYSGSKYEMEITCISGNVNDAEKAKLNYSVVYYLTDYESKTPATLLNAGTYSAVVTSTSANYNVTNGEVKNIVIAKKEVVVTITKSEFTYNASEQSIEYTLNTQIETSVTYSDTFKDAKTYTYAIVPTDENNYVLINEDKTEFVGGEAIINKAEITFALDKTEYDYTGSVFTISDIQLTTGSEVNGLYFVAYMGGQETTMQDAGTYTIVLKTTDVNYTLNQTEFEVKVKVTTIIITATTEYEYTGSDINFEYVAKNKREEILNVAGLSCTIKNEAGIEVSKIVSVGKYTYEFTASDPKFELSGESGTFEVVKAEISITMGDLTFNYNEKNNYPVGFTAISKFGVDFTSKFKLVYFDSENTETTLTNAKTYGFDVVLISEDENIAITQILNSDNSECDKVVTILPKKVEYAITRTYTYTGDTIALEYTPVGEFSETVVVILDKMRDAKDYNGTIYCENTNYYIYGEGLTVGEDYKTSFTVTVNKFVINVLPASENDGVYTFTYNGEKITPSINISLSDFSEYKIVVNGEVADIINAGEYTITLNSLNDNYEFAGECYIKVNPKSVLIEVDKTSLNQEYSRSLKTISYAIKDGEKIIDIESKVKYFVRDKATTVIYAGEYSYEIEITDPNYTGSLLSDEDSMFVVAKKKATVSVTPNQQKVYGDSDIALTYAIDGLCHGDSLDISLTRDVGEEAGLYRINLDTTEFDNYTINYVESYFKISPKQLLILAFDKEKVYGEADPAFKYAMYLDGKRVDKLLGTDTLTGSLSRVAGEDKGTYEILQGTMSNLNYDIVFSSANLEILPRTIDISIDDKSVVYGEQKELTYTVADEFKDVITGAPSREDCNEVGEYPITIGNIKTISENYVINLLCNGTYTITQKTLHVIAISTSKVYGQVDELKYIAIGLINDDELSGSLSRTPGENFGKYEINLGNLNNNNYDIKFVGATLSIEKANLSVVIDNKTQVYGKNSQKLTYSITGLVGDDKANIVLDRTGNDDAGSYQIFIKSMELSDNYYLESYLTGTYTITKADKSITIKPMTAMYTGKAVEFKDNSGFNLRYVYTLYGSPVSTPINAGSYRVKAYFDGDPNYNSAVSNETTLTILKQNVYITLGATEFIYDGQVKYPTFTYDNTLGLDENQFEFDFDGDVLPLEEGEYEFTLSVKDGLNYTGSVSGKVVIKEAFVLSTETSVVECDNATFDDEAQKVELVQTTKDEKFNNEKVLSVCSLKSTNGQADTNGYVYTVKVKATEDVTNAKVYRVSDNGYQQISLKIENGYFIFSVDSLEDEYIITTDIKKLSSLGWMVIYVLIGVTAVVTISIVLLKKFGKKKKLAKASKPSKPSGEVEDYHIM